MMNETGATLYDQPFNLGPTGLTNTLPLRVGVQPQGSANAPFRILAVGHRSAQVIVSRSATVQFVSGRVLLLRLPLLATCQNVSCPNPTDTCRDNGTCGSDVVDPTSLPDYHPGSDAGPPPDARDGGTVGGGGTPAAAARAEPPARGRRRYERDRAAAAARAAPASAARAGPEAWRQQRPRRG
jgi:hypothetical protein